MSMELMESIDHLHCDIPDHLFLNIFHFILVRCDQLGQIASVGVLHDNAQ